MDSPASHALPADSADAIESLIARHYPDCEPIAVVGLACRFPEAGDSEAFWRNLVEGRDCARRFTRQALLDAGLDAAMLDAPNFVNAGAVLDDADAFDAALFGYSRQEAELLDPQQRLFLQTVWHSLEHAGYAPREVPHKTGVFGAARISTYPGREPVRVTEVGRVSGLQSLMGNDKDYLATRAAYKLNLRGPALTVQTACSSSLVAVHMACESLRAGDCEMAVAGGVAVSFPQQAGYLHQPGMIFSPDGRCRPFDADAGGTFIGNGVGVVALRRLADALADGDPVVAVLRGSALNNDGSQKVGYTAPSVAGQRDAIREAMRLAGVRADEIGLIEAHGTGTPLGDPIEVEALNDVFRDACTEHPGLRCALGSVKSNLGHLDTAAGIASLIKAVLAVERGAIPPSLHFRRANPALGLERGPFYVPTATEAWTASVRTAGVSSFGIGGTNCHLIVASLPEALRARSGTSGQVRQEDSVLLPSAASAASAASAQARPDDGVLLLSAASVPALRRLAGAYAEALTHARPSDLAHTALHGRQLDLEFRLAAPLDDETGAALAAYAAGVDDVLVHCGSGPAGKVAWLFTGQGAHWPGMGRSLYAHSAAFAACLDRCLAACGQAFEPLLRDAMLGERAGLLERMEYAQPAIVAFELATAAHWEALGHRPDLVLGHSVGEYAAAVVAGHYSPEAIMPLVRLRGELMQRCNDDGAGAMLAAFADDATLLPIAARHGLDLAAMNGERHLVFSGAQAAVDAFAAELAHREIRHHRLAVGGAAHSARLDPILDEYGQAASRLVAGPARLPLISTLAGETIDAGALNAPGYWRRHMREPVRYRQALHCALTLEARVFLELGPDAPLTGIGQRDAPRAAHWIASARRGQPALAQLRQAAARLFAAGVALPWREVLPSHGRKLHAPLYPFDEARYWREAAPAAQTSGAPASAPQAADEALASGRRVAASAAARLDLPRLQALYDCVAQLHAVYVDELVRRSAGASFEHGASALDILRGGRLLPRHRQLLTRLLNACAEDGYYRRDGDRYAPARAVPHERRAGLLAELRSYCEGFDVIADTVERAGERLHAMMSGQVEPVAVIFPEGASGGVEVLYQDFSFGRYFNEIAAGVAAGIVRERARAGRRRAPLRILEVGGGTGGTTAWLLPQLAAGLADEPGLRYDFTDISALFTRRAQQKFAAYGFVDYREFDLQKSAAAQGFEAGAYDLVVAANVIHATQHVGRTLAGLRALLKPGGRLLMREITRPMRLFDFVFGPLVLPLHDEAARGGELFLSVERWEAQCRAAGFEHVDWLPEDGTATARISEHVLLARVPGRAAASALLPWSGAAGDVLLGQPLTGDGCYVADWSDCVGDAARWGERLAEACAELSRRHGSGRPIALPEAPVPAGPLSLVRLRYQGGPFGKARVLVEGRDGGGAWRLLTVAGERAAHDGLPAPSEAAGTHYEWVWRPAGDAAGRPAVPLGGFALAGAPEAAARALEAAGVALSPQAGRLLLVLDPADDAPLVLAEALLDALRDPARRPLVVVTRAAWAVRADEPVIAAQRAIWGMLRVAATETPEHPVAALDLAANADWRELPAALAALGALGSSDAADAGARWKAIRDGQAYAPHLAAQDYVAPALPAPSLAGDGWHLVTGAFGGLGRISVQWLARQGARRIALLAPRAPADWPAFRQALNERYGCDLLWLSVDVADLSRLHAALRQLDEDGGVAGAIHAAGVLDDAPLAALDAARLQTVLAVKADAARALRDWLQLHHGRYLLLYSSSAAALGAPGQGAHALASAYLDGLAQAHEAVSAPATVTVAWGAWGEAGRAAAPELKAKLAAAGMGVLSTAEGLWHLEQAVMRGAPYRLAMRVMPERLDAARRALLQAAPESDPSAAPASPQPPAHRQAPAPAAPPVLSGNPETDHTALTAWLGARIAAQLRLDDPARLTARRDLLELGLDSLLFLELSGDIERQLGVRLDAERAYRDLTVDGLARLIAELAPRAVAREAAMLAHDAANRHEPFPLTPIQHAYWLGRTGMIEYGGVACHVLFEWDKQHGELNLERFERAWNALVRRHDMLRMVVGADGRQRILEHVPEYRVARHDLRALPPEARERALAETREALSRRVLPAERWPLFELIASEIDAHRYRLHMNLDLLLFDVQSFKVMMDDLAQAYRGDPLEPLGITFRDYVMAEEAQRDEPSWREAWRYWHDALPHLPPAPRLPLAAREPSGPPRFTTHQARLPRAAWDALKRTWREWGATPSAALLALFAHTLAQWSRHPGFTVNLTFFNRRPCHPQVPQLIGDFTSVLLIDFDLGRPQTLRDTIDATQQRLWQRLAASRVNGVEVIRELGRGQPGGRQPLMPVVFTSVLGLSLDGQSIDQAMTSLLGDPVHVFTQTPQVWLDHQVMEIDGELVFSWYCMDGVLADGVAKAMFDDYRALLQSVAADPARMAQPGFVLARDDGSPAPIERRPWPAAVDGVNLDLRAIEDALRTHPAVRWAQALPDPDGRTLSVTIVAADGAPGGASSADSASPGRLELDPAAWPALSAAEQEEFDAAWRWLAARALQGIAGTLLGRDLFARAEDRHTLDEVQARLGALPKYRRLIRQWLSMLVDHGWLERDGAAFVCRRALGAVPAPEPAALPEAAWSRTLGAYLDACIARHGALLDGTQSPLALLLGDDERIVSSLYADNPVMRLLNACAAPVAEALSRGATDYRVLEVGAGIGATTAQLLPALDGRLASYRFTDVSTLFLEHARKRFAGCPRLEYALLDINQPVEFDAHPDSGYDLIVAANVMHDARHVTQSLRRLGRLLKPGGRLLLIEATERDSALQLASVGFIEALNGYHDIRTADDKPMLDLPMWRDALSEAGFATELVWPQEERTSLRQHLILARAERVARLDLGEIERHLRAPSRVLPPLRLRQRERIPLDGEHEAPPVDVAERTAGEDARPAQAKQCALEARVAEIWQALLSQPVEGGSDFFQSGGDSLIATRMIAQLNRQGVAGASLQNLFAHPTLAAFCATLDAAATAGDGNPVLLAKGRDAARFFLFHASDGELGAYLPLARQLDAEVYGLQAEATSPAASLEALAQRHVAALRARQAHGPYTLVGWSYGAFVAAEAARLLHEQREAVALVLLDPVCRDDFRTTGLAGLLRLLAHGRVEVPLPAGFDALTPDEQIACFMRNAAAAGLLGTEPGLPQARAWLARIERLLSLVVRHPAPAPLPIPCLWIGASRRPAHWQPAERDWRQWARHAERHTLEADHWQLVMDDPTAQRAATLLKRWRQHADVKETA
ncbi:type I polyketide synthase [Trinickia mobilis]|uniref:type I polyketide synthase n=1 Tax=Trinickia mobilis TaxID=2816356 RepID=UPI001A8CCFCE|nr:type I polyketide synthase [Trinickia mobilis]